MVAFELIVEELLECTARMKLECRSLLGHGRFTRRFGMGLDHILFEDTSERANDSTPTRRIPAHIAYVSLR